MSIRRSQASVLSGINTASTDKIDVVYNKVSAGFINSQNSLLFTGVSGASDTITIGNTTLIRPGQLLTVISGTGSFPANTTVLSIPNSTQIKTSAAPSVALSNATISAGGIEFTSSTTWSRPSNVHYIDLFLVGGGGSGAQGTGTRAGGGGGGGAVIQFNRFYVGDYDSWYILIAGQSSRAETLRGDCCCDSWGHGGNPTIFSPVATSFNKASLTGTDSTTFKRTLIAPAGGGGGHPCGSHGTYFASGGGGGSNGNPLGMWGWGGSGGQNDYVGAIRIGHQGYGGRPGSCGDAGGPGAGGGGAGGQASGVTRGAGKALQAPFSGTYGMGGDGGRGSSNGLSGTANTGNAGYGHVNSNTLGGYGASGRAGIRMYYSS